MVKDVFLLRAFEAGADAVIVLVSPEGACRYVEGNLRAKKRVHLVKNILDEIGLGGSRLSLFNVAAGDEGSVARIIRETRAALIGLGPNPARNCSRGEPTQQEIEQFFIACVITVGMITSLESRESDPRAEEFFRMRQNVFRKRLPWAQKSPEHGVSCGHPCSIDKYMEWCADRCREQKP